MAYTTSEAVAQFLGAPDFSTSTTPTKQDVLQIIDQNDSYIDQRTGLKWETALVSNEVHDLKDIDVEDRATIKNLNDLFLTNVSAQMRGGDLFGAKVYVHRQPLLSITTLQERTSALGATEVWSTLTADTDYKVYSNPDNLTDGSGYFLLLGAKMVFAHRKLRVTYNYGLSTTPAYIKRLSNILTSIQVLRTERRAQGTLHLSEVELGQARYKFGGPYSQTIKDLKDEAEEIFERTIGQKMVYV